MPKADLHQHAETAARIDNLVASRQNQQTYDWAEWAKRTEELPPGPPRLRSLYATKTMLHEARQPSGSELHEDDSVTFIEWVGKSMEESASRGAILTEIRFGGGHILRPAFMTDFREAERQARLRYPRFFAEAIITGLWPHHDGASEVFARCLEACGEGLAGIDFIPAPYETEADWPEAHDWASQAVAAGLGITAHAGEFSTANIASALRLPGIRRIGHAVHSTSDRKLLGELVSSGVTVECCLTSNLILGSVEALDVHPIIRFVEAGIPVTINTDDPVRLSTNIGREYQVAAGLGFSTGQLNGFTRTSLESSFTSPERKAEMLTVLDGWHVAS